MLQKKYNRILALSFIYTVCFGSILLAFPKSTGYNDATFDGIRLWVAKKSTWLPVKVQWWESSSPVTTNNSATNTVSKPKPIKPSTSKPSSTKQLTCSDVGICDKVHFWDGYTTKQKTDYYTAILYTIDNIQKAFPAAYKKLSESIFSISLSPTLSDRRWRWGSKTIIINTADITSIQEFREILTHELGHIIDLGSIVWKNSTMDPNFTLSNKASFSIDDPSLQFYRISWANTTTKKADASFTDFVWGYAMTTPYEDFSESFNMYLRHHDVFRAMALQSEKLQKKYNYVQSLVGGYFFQADRKTVSLVTSNNNWRPWDSTRMSLD